MAIHIIHYKIEQKFRDDDMEVREYFRVEKPSCTPYYPHTVITDQVVEDTRDFSSSSLRYDSSWQCFLALDRKNRKLALDDGIEIITEWMKNRGLEVPCLIKGK